jgi:predicted AAA+ superfamily ATPase
MIVREIASLLLEYARSFRSVVIVGPRQSGKTTLAKACFPGKPYVSLENPDMLELANQDPRGFLGGFSRGAILDEIQRAPQLFNYLQEILDNSEEDGLFILTGSNNILLQENISQTLAGRIGILDLLPLSYREIRDLVKGLSLPELIVRGFYPEIYHKNRSPQIWYQSYIRTYLERDVRQIKQIENTLLFQKFLRLCAGSVGQQVNYASLSNDCGIDVRTVHSWLSVLENSFVLYRLQPFHQNFKKRLVKSPKIYFVDTGLACALLNIKSPGEFSNSHFKGALVENFVVSECLKNKQNLNQYDRKFYFWRDNNGTEIDLIVEAGDAIAPVEIKSAQTYSNDFSRSMKKFMLYSGTTHGTIVYNGSAGFKGSDGIDLLNWKDFFVSED